MYDHKKDFIFLIIMNIPECSLWNFISIISSKKKYNKAKHYFPFWTPWRTVSSYVTLCLRPGYTIRLSSTQLS